LQRADDIQIFDRAAADARILALRIRQAMAPHGCVAKSYGNRWKVYLGALSLNPGIDAMSL